MYRLSDQEFQKYPGLHPVQTQLLIVARNCNLAKTYKIWETSILANS